MAENDQKTEQPTPRRLIKAREEGNFVAARMFVSSMQFLAFVAMLHAFGPAWIAGLQRAFTEVLSEALNPRLSPMDIAWLGVAILRQTMTPVALMGVALIVIALAIQLVVTGFGLSVKKLTPDFKRLDPLTKLRQLPQQNLFSLLQAVVMIPVFGAVVYFLVSDNIAALIKLPVSSLLSGVNLVGSSIDTLLWKAAAFFLIFGVVDLVRQKSRYTKDLRMSKQEIRDEAKEVDGNPVVKAKIRRLRRDAARRRMMKEIPTATAVIVNPTHYAVALAYDLETRGAPRVVAKGKTIWRCAFVRKRSNTRSR